MGFGGGSGVSPSVRVFPCPVNSLPDNIIVRRCAGGGRTGSCSALVSDSHVAEGQGPRDVGFFRRFKFYSWHLEDGIFTARISDMS